MQKKSHPEGQDGLILFFRKNLARDDLKIIFKSLSAPVDWVKTKQKIYFPATLMVPFLILIVTGAAISTKVVW
jgi:hypothetical protein